MSTDLNNGRESAQSTLFKAIEAGDTAAVLSILAERPELAQCADDEGQTPLHLAAAFDDIRVALILLSHGADVQARYGPFGHTPLSWAVTCNSQGFAKGLIKLGVPPDLFVAAGAGELRLVQSFFNEAGELLPHASQTGSTRYASNGAILPCPPELPIEVISDALYIACRNSHYDVVEWLLTKSPDLRFKAYMGGTPLHWAYFGGSRDIIDLLIRKGADTQLRDDVVNCTPRLFGIAAPASWGLKFLVEKQLRLDPDLARLMDGVTSVLHVAIRNKHHSIIDCLVQHGADTDQPDGDGRSAIQLAKELHDSEALKRMRHSDSE